MIVRFSRWSNDASVPVDWSEVYETNTRLTFGRGHDGVGEAERVVGLGRFGPVPAPHGRHVDGVEGEVVPPGPPDEGGEVEVELRGVVLLLSSGETHRNIHQTKERRPRSPTRLDAGAAALLFIYEQPAETLSVLLYADDTVLYVTPLTDTRPVCVHFTEKLKGK